MVKNEKKYYNPASLKGRHSKLQDDIMLISKNDRGRKQTWKFFKTMILLKKMDVVKFLNNMILIDVYKR